FRSWRCCRCSAIANNGTRPVRSLLEGPGTGAFFMRALWSSGLDECEARLENAQDAREIVPSLEDQPAHRHDAVGSLTPHQPWVLLDPVKRALARTPEYGENGAILHDVDRIVAPLARGDFCAIDGEDRI